MGGKRQPVAVRGSFVRSATVGQVLALETRDGDARRIYLTHVDWIPALDEISIARIRAAWAGGAYTARELAQMFCTSESTVKACAEGKDSFRRLPPIGLGSGIAETHGSYAHLRYGEASSRLAQLAERPL